MQTIFPYKPETHKPHKVVYAVYASHKQGEFVMTSEQKILANQKNALKSTGPNTPEGKDHVSQNAITHGLLSKTLIVNGEASEAYEDFRENILDDLQPIGAMEILLVEKIVNYAWRLRRAVQAETIFLEAGLTNKWNPMTLDSFFGGADSKKIQNISRYETTIEKHFYRSLKELREVQAIRRTKESNEHWGFGFVS
jgi:hypothetical protein